MEYRRLWLVLFSLLTTYLMNFDICCCNYFTYLHNIKSNSYVGTFKCVLCMCIGLVEAKLFIFFCNHHHNRVYCLASHAKLFVKYINYNHMKTMNIFT